MSSQNASQPPPLRYNFTISRRGTRSARAWPGEAVALLVESAENDVPCVSAPGYARAALMRALDSVYATYVHITGGDPPRREEPFRGRVVIQVPIDNAGAAGLAHHGVAGISVGAGLVRPLAERWTRACRKGVKWLPSGNAGNGLEGLRFGPRTPKEASVDQVFFYEFSRNFWHPWYNKKIDWACNGDPSCWGWWTVGMNNALAVIVPALIDLPMNYFGRGRSQFRDRMVDELKAYMRYARTVERPFDAWTVSLMPWKPKESVNDLMSGLLIRSFERFGEERWIRGFFREIARAPDVNPTAAGGTQFQACRDNVYRIFSRAADANLIHVFTNELRWDISSAAQSEISAQFPQDNTLSLNITL